MFRILWIAGCVVVLAGSAGQAQTMSAPCAERDLKAIAFIEQHGEAGDLAADLLGQLGLKQLDARLNCIAREETMALAIYDDVLGAARFAERAKP
jgi:hypothetical protein